jgi:hypothetical protein
MYKLNVSNIVVDFGRFRGKMFLRGLCQWQDAKVGVAIVN